MKVVLYACSCGSRLPGGSFASPLAVALRDIEAVVFGHHNVGHTTTNANIYRYCGDGRGVAVAPTGKFTAFYRYADRADPAMRTPVGIPPSDLLFSVQTPDEMKPRSRMAAAGSGALTPGFRRRRSRRRAAPARSHAND